MSKRLRCGLGALLCCVLIISVSGCTKKVIRRSAYSPTQFPQYRDVPIDEPPAPAYRSPSRPNLFGRVKNGFAGLLPFDNKKSKRRKITPLLPPKTDKVPREDEAQ